VLLKIINLMQIVKKSDFLTVFYSSRNNSCIDWKCNQL